MAWPARFPVFPALMLLALTACKTSSPSPLASASASASSSASASPPASALVDLLLETDAKVTVSSRVDNPSDYPEHLVDGRPDTAWNGKTDDLSGWIEIVLPRDVTVSSIAITAGFDKKKGADDLFTMNHRISKLRITRDGALVKEATLDTSRRSLQNVPVSVDASGGRWRIEVVDTLPGTRKEWRELVVSDLKMYGIAGAARLPAPRLPKVLVAPGSAPPPLALPAVGVDSVPSEGRFATSMRALCDGFTADMVRAIRKEMPGSNMTGPFCRPIEHPPAFEGSLPIGWKAVHAVDLERFFGNMVSTTSHLVIEGDDGTFMIGPHYRHRDDLGCFSTPEQVAAAFRLARRGAQNWLVASRTEVVSSYALSTSGGGLEVSGGTAEFEALVCALAGTKISCPERFSPMGKRAMTRSELEAFQAKPELRWPKLAVDGGPTAP